MISARAAAAVDTIVRQRIIRFRIPGIPSILYLANDKRAGNIQKPKVPFLTRARVLQNVERNRAAEQSARGVRDFRCQGSKIAPSSGNREDRPYGRFRAACSPGDSHAASNLRNRRFYSARVLRARARFPSDLA